MLATAIIFSRNPDTTGSLMWLLDRPCPVRTASAAGTS